MQADIPVLAPYRLDLTVAVLRRLPTNIVDVLTPDGTYRRALSGSAIVRVRQDTPEALSVSLDGAPLEIVRRMLGVDRDVMPFTRAAKRIPLLRSLVTRMVGVKPPRYPTLWEACVNAIVYQQLSLAAASEIVRRLIVALSPAVVDQGVTLYPFPGSERFQSADDSTLRATGLSRTKIETLRRVADAQIDEAALEASSSADAAAQLQRVKGIGPWTAALILLRGLGRLDVFPANDSGALRNLASLSAGKSVKIEQLLDALGSQRGMLYYHLLLSRLDARGQLP